MSSTQIQLDRDRVVSVQTQSITALSSVRKGTRRNLEQEHKLNVEEMAQLFIVFVCKLNGTPGRGRG